MQNQKDLEVFTLFQPDLLTRTDLIEMIQRRCCGVQNLSTMSTERLVEIFRRLILPLPQRFYRTNRRGKMLTARRAKPDFGGKRKRGKEEEGDRPRKVALSEDRLRPPPSRSGSSTKSKSALEDVIVKDGRKIGDKEEERRTSGISSNKKITLKRSSSGSEKAPSSSATTSENKKQRVTIKWP